MNVDRYENRPAQRTTEQKRSHISASRDPEPGEVLVVVAKVDCMCPTAHDLRCIVEPAEQHILIEMKYLRTAVCRNVTRKGYAQTRKRPLADAALTQIFEQESCMHKDKRGDQIVPGRIPSEIQKIEVVPPHHSAHLPKRGPRLGALFHYAVVRVQNTDLSLSGKFAEHAVTGIVEKKESGLMAVGLHPGVIKDLPLFRREEKTLHGKLGIQSMQPSPKIPAPMRIDDLFNKQSSIVSQSNSRNRERSVPLFAPFHGKEQAELLTDGTRQDAQSLSVKKA